MLARAESLGGAMRARRVHVCGIGAGGASKALLTSSKEDKKGKGHVRKCKVGGFWWCRFRCHYHNPKKLVIGFASYSIARLDGVGSFYENTYHSTTYVLRFCRHDK